MSGPQLVVVEVGGKRLGVPAARVREVAAISTVTPVPTAPSPVVGLTQLRGHILPVLDLAKVSNHSLTFTDEGKAPRPNDPLLVVELGPARAGLLVDRVLGVQATECDVVDIGALFDQLRAAVLP